MKASLGTLFILFLTLFFTTAHIQAQEKPAKLTNDWLLIPDRRAGPITRNWTGKDIVGAFSELHCVKENIPIGEGETVPGYRIYPDTDDELIIRLDPETGKVESASIHADFEIIKDPDTGEFIGSRMVSRKSRWHSISGITLGSTVEDVEKVNGRPFFIEGWEIDYPGVVTSWEKGKIPDTFGVRFHYADQKEYEKLWNKVLDEGEKWDGSSSGKIMKALKPTAYFVIVRL